MHIKQLLRIQFIRQLLGGIGGALVALTVYTAYANVSMAVRAYLAPSAAERLMNAQEKNKEPVQKLRWIRTGN